MPAGRPASLVVLDLSFSPDAMVRAPVGAHLLGFYLFTGKPIIALGRGDVLLAGALENQLVALERTPDRGDFLATVRSVILRLSQRYGSAVVHQPPVIPRAAKPIMPRVCIHIISSASYCSRTFRRGGTLRRVRFTAVSPELPAVRSSETQHPRLRLHESGPILADLEPTLSTARSGSWIPATTVATLPTRIAPMNATVGPTGGIHDRRDPVPDDHVSNKAIEADP